MHRIALTAVAVAASMYGGSIQGVALEHVSGRPLARTMVRLEPVAKPDSPPGNPLSTRAGRSGYFVFPAVAPGLYLITAERDGFFPAAYGQRLPIGRATPVTVTADSNLFAELRLRHKGAITGRVFDENGVGRAGTTVIAYRAQLPLRSAGSAVSDDRGVYRIHGLPPGKFWVRSAAQTLEDGSGWLPTYGPQGRETRDARVHRVTVDSDTADADVSPDTGALFRLGGTVTCDSAGEVTVVLSSETGRRQAQTACGGGYSFEGLAPGNHEIYARLKDTSAAGFMELFLGGDHLGANIQVMRVPSVDIEVRRSVTGAPLDLPVKLVGRRQDLSESESIREIKGTRVPLPPGYWEFRAEVPDGNYVESITDAYGGGSRRRKRDRPPDTFEVFIEPRTHGRIRILVSERVGVIEGVVRAESRPVPAAPVFLWPVDDAARRSIGGPKQMLTDTEGRFRFASLPPGDYRILASFDINEMDEELLELSQAKTVRAEGSQTTVLELAVWRAP